MQSRYSGRAYQATTFPVTHRPVLLLSLLSAWQMLLALLLLNLPLVARLVSDVSGCRPSQPRQGGELYGSSCPDAPIRQLGLTNLQGWWLVVSAGGSPDTSIGGSLAAAGVAVWGACGTHNASCRVYDVCVACTTTSPGSVPVGSDGGGHTPLCHSQPCSTCLP